MELKIYRAKEASVDKSILAKNLTNRIICLQIEIKGVAPPPVPQGNAIVC